MENIACVVLIVSLFLGAIFICYLFMEHGNAVEETFIYSTHIALIPRINQTERDMDTTGEVPNNATQTYKFTSFRGLSAADLLTAKLPNGTTVGAVSASSDVLNSHADDRLVYNRIPKSGSQTAIWLMDILSKRNNFTLVESEVYNQPDLTLKEEVGKQEDTYLGLSQCICLTQEELKYVVAGITIN